MTDEQIRQDANAREAADRADNSRQEMARWCACENAANRAHELAVLDAKGRHCENMARIDSSSGSGHPLGVVGRGLEAVGISPFDVGAVLRKHVDPETPFDRFERIFVALVEAATPIALAYAAKMNAAPADDRPSMRAVISGKNAIPAMLGALAALGYGGAGGDAQDAEDEFAEYVGKPRAEWTGEDAATMFRVLAECAERIRNGESAADVVDDIVKRVNARNAEPPADTDGE
jgi:hypothetical protein